MSEAPAERVDVAVTAAALAPEEYYGKHYPELLAAKAQMDDLVEEFVRTHSPSDDLAPVVYHTSRIKSPASLVEKIGRKGGQGATFQDALAVGINDIVGQGFWDDAVEMVERGFGSGKPIEAVCDAIRLCGEKLSAHFPPQENDEDELPNQVSFQK